MGNKYQYKLSQKILFYLAYFWYKLILPLEMKSPRWKFWLYEIIYTLNKFIRYESSYPYPFGESVMKTRWGSFKIRAKTSDAANVSPAFERRDVNFLIRLLKKLVAEQKKVLFLDIGGDIGTYSVLVGRLFPAGQVKAVCFEPVPESYKLIGENLELNQLTGKVDVVQAALFSLDGQSVDIEYNVNAPGSSTMKNSKADGTKKVTVITKRLDTLLGKTAEPYDAVVFKIDVEGVEKEVLQGSTSILNSGKDVYIMIEDFVNPTVIDYLEEENISFLTKRTDYNSWWTLKKGRK